MHPSSQRSRFSRLLLGLQVQWNVVGALVYRELMTRLSQSQYGIIGVFIEPLATLLMFVVIFSALRASAQTSLDISLFLLSGITPFGLFREITTRSLRSMEQNAPVFIYRPVRPVDTIIARTIVESGLSATLYISLFLVIMFVRERWWLDDPPLLFVAFVSTEALAFGIGLILLVAGHRYKLIQKFFPAIMRPMFLTSGIFFSLGSIPQAARPWLSWNPILQATELTRHAFSTDYHLDPAISLPYLLLVTGLSCVVGVVSYSGNERHLMRQ
jgi:capsular polysaccharide transport system permease protein